MKKYFYIGALSVLLGAAYSGITEFENPKAATTQTETTNSKAATTQTETTDPKAATTQTETTDPKAATTQTETTNQKTTTSNQLISMDKAISIAQQKFSGTVAEVELDYEYGMAVYEIELYNGYNECDIDINAETGDILKFEPEYNYVSTTR